MAVRADSVYIFGMTQKPKLKPDDPEQYKRFLEAAKKAEADETEEGADKAFKKVITPKGKKT
jgi:hypothetical protein